MDVLHPKGWSPAVGYANGIAVRGGNLVQSVPGPVHTVP